MGDLESGSVVGQRFKELSVDLDIHATEIGGLKVLYPPVSVLDLKSRPGNPVLLRVTNRSTSERGFLMTTAANRPNGIECATSSNRERVSISASPPAICSMPLEPPSSIEIISIPKIQVAHCFCSSSDGSCDVRMRRMTSGRDAVKPMCARGSPKGCRPDSLAMMKTKQEESHSVRVLLVDDSSSALHELETALSKQNRIMVVGTAWSEIDAQAAVQICRSNVVVLEMLVGRMSGINICRTLRQNIRTSPSYFSPQRMMQAFCARQSMPGRKAIY